MAVVIIVDADGPADYGDRVDGGRGATNRSRDQGPAGGNRDAIVHDLHGGEVNTLHAEQRIRRGGIFEYENILSAGEGSDVGQGDTED